MKAILGTKIGMTQIFDERGRAVPVTLIFAQPNTVTQVKVKDRDGYAAVQVGAGERRHLIKPALGHLKKSGLSTTRILREFRLPARLSGQGPGENEEVNLMGSTGSPLKEGDRIDLSVFQEGDMVSVTGITKGKGFAGVVKRYRFAGAPASHGADHQRQPGSIGAQRPQRVIKGKKLPGKMGGEQRTVTNLRVVKVDPERHLLAIRGAIPGPNKSWLIVRGT